MRLGNERGLALLSALLTVALLTLIVVEMTDATFVHSHLTRNAGNALAAQLLARSAQIGAQEALKEARRDEQIRAFVDNFIDGAPLTLPTAQGHLMQIAIRDESGRLNLNLASDEPEPFDDLFADLGLEPRLLDAVRARIDAGTDDGFRNLSGDCSLPVPCEPRPGELRTFDDLRTIEGFNDEALARLRPFVTAYPKDRGDREINLRTARPEVLRAIRCEDTESLPPVPRSEQDVAEWIGEQNPCDGSSLPTKNNPSPKLYSILTIATVGDATQAVEATVNVTTNGGPIAWKQRPVWGVGPGGVP